MSAPEDRQSPHEIVIVRRRPGGHGDGHHGGAWKIAFADFMTALMCFFLVMWLVNASDKQTITQIATYFNPLRLNDRLTSRKGIDDPDSKPEQETGGQKGKSKAPARDSKSKKEQKGSGVSDGPDRSAQAERMLATEMDLIRDPYGVLEQIVASQPGSVRAQPVTSDSRSRMPKDLFDTQGTGPAERRLDVPRPATDRSQQVPQSSSKVSSSHGAPSGDGELTAARLKSDIAQAIARLDAPLKPRVEVTDEGKEVLVSITEDIENGMFSVGSSRPTAVLIQVMEAVARALAGNGGPVIVRGHTDARPYAAGLYDNWRLSSVRAQVAYTMLVRGGLASERVQRIEGHADRKLRVPADPLSPQNRRIEILIVKERT